jgi:hypothetical protein
MVWWRSTFYIAVAFWWAGRLLKRVRPAIAKALQVLGVALLVAATFGMFSAYHRS